MKRSSVNFIIDLVTFLDMLGLIFTGFVIKYILPPGSGGRGRMLRGGRGTGEEIRSLWSMTRHEWGDIHFYFAVVFTALIVVHIVLHWGWIKAYIKSLFCFSSKTAGS